MPRITVNGQILEVPEGRTILEALDDLGQLRDDPSVRAAVEALRAATSEE